jgi:dTDP-glucose 4,6-dehydratase
VVNFAAETHVDRSIDTPEPFFQTNVIGTLRLLNATRQYWKSLSPEDAQAFRFLHVSTDEVFGSLEPQDPAFCETTPYAPNSPYSASKAASDHTVRAFHHTYGLPILITNCSNNYGPFQFPEKLIPLMILNALEQRPLPIYGDGGQVRDWLYVQDHCVAIAQSLTKGKVGETYVIGGDSECTNLHIVDTLCQILDELQPRADGKAYAELKQFVTDRPGHDRRYAINFSKITQELGWKPSVSLAEGLRQTVQWYLSNRAWCQDISQRRYNRQRLGGGEQ